MLQVITRKFYPDDIKIHSTAHRGVLFTNRWIIDRAPIELPLATLEASTNSGPVTSVTLSIVEHMAAVRPDGTDSPLVAIGGDQLLDDYADLLSFGLNSVFHRDNDLVRNLVPSKLGEGDRGSASRLFRGTFDPGTILLQDELDGFAAFIQQVLGLGRADYECVIRAVRRVTRATRTAAGDPTGGYADMVAALESLSEGADVPNATWDQLDSRKRRIFETAFGDLSEEKVRELQGAVMSAEYLGLASRFRAFTKANVDPSFFRAECSGAIRPIREPDFDKAVRKAYEVRSRNVHTLWDLPQEAWVYGDRADTAEPREMGVILSLEGLLRLTRHVIRNHVANLEPVANEEFDWTTAFPNVLSVNLAAEIWLPVPEGFDHRSAGRYFQGVAEHFLSLHQSGGTEVADMTAVLQLVEDQVPGLTDGTPKTQMVAMYFVWHNVLSPEAHLDRANEFLDEFMYLLEPPSFTAFVAFLLVGRTPSWSPDEWASLADERDAERRRVKSVALDPPIEAALHVAAANALLDIGCKQEAADMVSRAIGELPGNAALIAYETSLESEDPSRVDPVTLVIPVQETE